MKAERAGSDRPATPGGGALAGPSRPAYDLAKSLLGLALSIQAMWAAGAALNATYVGAAFVAGFLGLSGGLGLAFFLAAGVVASLAAGSSPSQAAQMLSSLDAIAWISSPSGVVVAATVAVGGGSAGAVEKAANFAATFESVATLRPTRSWDVVTVGEYTSSGLSVAEYVAEKLASGGGNAPADQRTAKDPSPRADRGGGAEGMLRDLRNERRESEAEAAHAEPEVALPDVPDTPSADVQPDAGWSPPDHGDGFNDYDDSGWDDSGNGVQESVPIGDLP